MPKIYPFLILLLYPICLVAQYQSDSLYQIWEDKSLADTTRCEAIYRLIRKDNENVDTTLHLIQLYYDFAKKNRVSYRVGQALELKGTAYDTKRKYFEALELHEQALEIFETLGRKKAISNSLNNIGGIHQIFIYCNAANIIKVGTGNFYAVYFRFYNFYLHGTKLINSRRYYLLA